jgi:hypothetical protein
MKRETKNDIQFLVMLGMIILLVVANMRQANKIVTLGNLETYRATLPSGAAALKIYKRTGKDGTEFYEVLGRDGQPLVYIEPPQ